MIRIADIEHLLGEDVVVTCSDGEVLRGRIVEEQSVADDPDEPESITLSGWKYPLTEVLANEIETVTKV